MAHAGEADSPEFGKLVARLDRFGPILAVLGVTLVVLMIWKPGSGCADPFYRC